ncbi:MAG: class II aldolase/adducin family protein [Anaerolineae bacterium]|nr:class II aldolase/adducin family protein [Anaerolineae bacterium]
MRFNFQSPRQQLVEVMNRIYYGGMTTLSGGNLSILDDDGCIWITPSAIDKGKLTGRDIICVCPDGTIDGPHPPSVELPFHRAIYQQRPDVRAIVHAHSPALVSFSIVRKIPDTNLIPQASRVCGAVGYAPYALPGSEALGESIANAFAQGYDVVLLENHGVATAGATLLEAFQRLETLDFCARTQMYAQGLGRASALSDEQINLFDHREHLLEEFTPATHTSRERELREKLADIVHRACQRQLMISTEGVASARVDDDSFLITPTGFDRPSIDPENIVLIQDGKREAGKLPSRSVRLHRAIYQKHPEVECIITSQAPFITAYAVAEKSLDTKTIPESYIMLLDVPKIEFGKQYMEPELIADVISPLCPVVLLQNDCVLTTGKSVLQAFDRLEVAEFTARSLIETASIGTLVPISDDEIAAITTKFLQ